MKQQDHGDDRFACFICRLNFSGLTGTKIILWLLAITIVSFVIGFGILALSGGMAPGKDSPFLHTAALTPKTTSFPLGNATAGKAEITLGAGELAIRDNAPAGTFVQATVFSSAKEWQPVVSQSMNGTTTILAMTDRGYKGKEWVAVNSPNRWEILLSSQVPLDLSVAVGAGDSTLDLGPLNLNSLSVSNGAGETDVDLAGYHGMPFTGIIHNGVGDLTIRVAKNSNTCIIISQGVGDVGNRGLVQHDEKYITDYYNPSLPATEILVEQGVGDIRVEAV